MDLSTRLTAMTLDDGAGTATTAPVEQSTEEAAATAQMPVGAAESKAEEEGTLDDDAAAAFALQEELSGGFQIHPRTDCPHAAEHCMPCDVNDKGIAKQLQAAIDRGCGKCGSKEENWVCAKSLGVFCGRHVKGHMVEHAEATGNRIAVGLRDLSFWCYGCDSYLSNYHIAELTPLYSHLHFLKFGEFPPKAATELAVSSAVPSSTSGITLEIVAPSTSTSTSAQQQEGEDRHVPISEEVVGATRGAVDRLELPRFMTLGRRRTGLVFDDRMLLHKHPRGHHPERPERVLTIWQTLNASGMAQQCTRVPARPATDEELRLAHKDRVRAKTEALRDERTRQTLFGALGRDSLFANAHTAEAARLSCGGVVALLEAMCAGTVTNGIAVVRPPGHHAECCASMGFCFYNNVAVGIKTILHQAEMKRQAKANEGEGKEEDEDEEAAAAAMAVDVKKVLIVDWDVHHGNGTQDIFIDDPNVLFFSVHRYDNGNFYPGGTAGAPTVVGDGKGKGANINVAWNDKKMGDADYQAVWDQILLPAARAFQPDLVVVSAGFDAAEADPLGGCCLSPSGYANLLHALLPLCQGRVAVCLEGGYNIRSISASSAACAAVLLGHVPPPPCSEPRTGARTRAEKALPPSVAKASARAAIRATIEAHRAARKEMEAAASKKSVKKMPKGLPKALRKRWKAGVRGSFGAGGEDGETQNLASWTLVYEVEEEETESGGRGGGKKGRKKK